MGFLGFLKKKEAQPAEEPAKEEAARIDGLDSWFRQRFGDRLDSAGKKGQGMLSEIAGRLDSLKGVSRTLEKAQFESGDKTYAAVNMIKDDYAKKLKRASACACGRPSGDYASLKEFHSSASAAVSDLFSIGPRQSILLSRYFSSDMKGVVDEIKGIKDMLGSMGEFLSGEGRLLWLSSEIRSLLDAREESSKRIEELRKRLEDSDRKAVELSGKIALKEEELKAFLGSDEWKGYLSLKEGISSGESRLAAMEEEVSSALSVAKRPLKKFRHMGDQKASMGGSFQEFSSNPSSFSSAISRALEADIGLKGKEKEKLRGLASRLGELERKAEEHRRLSDSISKKREELKGSSAQAKREMIESSLEDMRTRKERMESDAERDRKLLSQLEEGHMGFGKKAEELISCNTEIRLTVS
jgi:hypothetical protein